MPRGSLLRTSTRLGPLAGAAAALALVALALPARPARSELADIGGNFEAWEGSTPADWNVSPPGAAARSAGEGVSGSAAAVTVAGSAVVLESPAIAISGGSTLSGSVFVRGPSTGSVAVGFRTYDANLKVLSTVTAPAVPASPAYAVVSSGMDLNAPTVGFVRLTLTVSGTGTVYLDDAALDIIAAEPTPTETTAATATPTPTLTPTATVPDPGEPTATVAGTTTAPATATPTRTGLATAPASRTATRTPTLPATATPKGNSSPRPASPTAPLATSTPAVPAGSGSGGLLRNGDFEVVSAGKPAYWQKFGGEMRAGDGLDGGHAACLDSTTASTKWLYQVVGVEGAGWYTATAFARVEGSGTASVRVSWYASADASGSQMEVAESGASVSSEWASLTTGPVQAPQDARSARVRLTFQPDGVATACFDDAMFFASAEPAPTATAVTPPLGETSTAAAATPTATFVRGNAVSAVGTPAPPSQASPDGAANLRISEILSDPTEAGRDGDYEWVELVNAGVELVELSGWSLGDGNRSQVLPAFVVAPGQFVVIAGEAAPLPPGIATVRVPGGIGNGLGNEGDSVRLTAPNGLAVDEMSYGDNTTVFDPAPRSPAAGQTIGLTSPEAEAASENWAITLRPTPGEPNLFPPKAASTVAGVTTRPAVTPVSVDALVEVDGGTGETSIAPWIILGGIGGVSIGVAGAVWGKKVQSLGSRFHAR